jgi:hypothetical protein
MDIERKTSPLKKVSNQAFGVNIPRAMTMPLVAHIQQLIKTKGQQDAKTKKWVVRCTVLKKDTSTKSGPALLTSVGVVNKYAN